MADMEIVRQFNSELSTLYATKPPISKAKVTSITRLALKAVKYYKHVVQSLEKFVQKCRPEYKIPALYVIDSIIRQSRHQFGADKDVFGPRFGKNITHSFQNFFKCLPEEQSKLIKVLNLWQKNKVYSPEVVQPLLNMAHTRPMADQQGGTAVAAEVKAVPADTTQPGHMAQNYATQQSGTGETPQEQAYIMLLQQQQEEQMKHIQQLQERLQQQQHMSQQIQESQGTTHTPSGEGEPRFQLPTEVFAQIQALTGMVQQQSDTQNYSSEQYTGVHPAEQYNHQQDAYPTDGYGRQQQHSDQSYGASQQHQGFVDDFDYGDDQDDAQRIEEKKRQLEEEQSRLLTKSSFEHDDSLNARQRMEEQFRQQQLASNVPTPVVPETRQSFQEVQRKLEAKIEPKVEQGFPVAQLPVLQTMGQVPQAMHEKAEHRSRSRSPRDRKHRDIEREHRDGERERGRERDRHSDGSDRRRSRDDRDKARGDRDRTREDRERSRGDRERSRGEREDRERSRAERDEKPRVDREDRERSRGDEKPRERRELDKEQIKKEEEAAEDKKEVKIEKWVPPVKDGHLSVCSRTVWVAKLNRSVTKESLEELFQECGEVQLIDMIPPRGCAYIQMAEREAAYRSLSHRQILRTNYKLAWAPAKGAKEYKEYFDKELGVTYIPVAKLEKSNDTMSSLAEGGWIDPRTIPESLSKKEEEAAAAAAATAATAQAQAAPVAAMPMGMPPGFPSIPPPGWGMPGMPMPGMQLPPGANFPPGMQFPPGVNPFQRMPFAPPGVNPFMMPGVMPGTSPIGVPPPGMPPFFSPNVPPPTIAPVVPSPANKTETADQSHETNLEADATQTVSSDQTAPMGQNQEEGQSQEQYGDPNIPPGSAPSFQGQGGPPFPGGPQFRQPFGQDGQNFNGGPDNQFQGPPQYGKHNPWRPDGQQWQGESNDSWGNQGGWQNENQWQNDQWGNDRQWSDDRRGRRRHGSQDESFDRRKRGRFENDWGHDRRRGPQFDHRGRPYGREDRYGPPGHHGPQYDDRQPWRPQEARMEQGGYEENAPWDHNQGDGRYNDSNQGGGRHGEGGFRDDHYGGRSHSDFHHEDRNHNIGYQGDSRHGDGYHGDGRQGDGRRSDEYYGDRRQGDGRYIESSQGDNRHGEKSHEIPPLMDVAPTESETPSEKPSTSQAASTEDEAKGWLEIYALKQRLALDKKNAGRAVSSEDSAKETKTMKEGDGVEKQATVKQEASETSTDADENKVGGNDAENQVVVEQESCKPNTDATGLAGHAISGPAPSTEMKEDETIATGKGSVSQKCDLSNNDQGVVLETKESDIVGTGQGISDEGSLNETVSSGESKMKEEDVLESELNVAVESSMVVEAKQGLEKENMDVDQKIVAESQAAVTSEQAELVNDGQGAKSLDNIVLDKADDMKPGPEVIKSEAVITDAVVKQQSESPVVAPEVSESREKMSAGDPVFEASALEESNVVVGNLGVSLGSDEVKMVSGEVKAVSDEFKMGSGGIKIGSDEVKVGPKEVKMETDEGTEKSDEVNMESDEVELRSSEVKMGSGEFKVGSDELKLGSDEVKVEPDEFRMGSDGVKMESDDCRMGSDEGKMGSEKVDIVSDEVEMGSDESKIIPDEVKMTSSEAGGSEAISNIVEGEIPSENEDTASEVEMSLAVRNYIYGSPVKVGESSGSDNIAEESVNNTDVSMHVEEARRDDISTKQETNLVSDMERNPEPSGSETREDQPSSIVQSMSSSDSQTSEPIRGQDIDTVSSKKIRLSLVNPEYGDPEDEDTSSVVEDSESASESQANEKSSQDLVRSETISKSSVNPASFHKDEQSAVAPSISTSDSQGIPE